MTCTASVKPAGSTCCSRRAGAWATWATKANPTSYTPIKKRPNIDLRAHERQLNRTFARIRVSVEWGVGHLKNWRILATRYRSDLARIDTDIQATVGLHKRNEHFSGRRLTYDRIKAA